MKKRNKILYMLLIILILLFIFSVLFIFNHNKDNNSDLLINNQTISDNLVEDILFSNIRYTYDNEYTIITFDITNKSESDVTLNHFIINVYDSYDNLINSFHPIYNDKLHKNDTITNFSASVALDLRKGSKIIIELPEIIKEEKE